MLRCRGAILPAVMELLGDWKWYLPAHVRRVLRVPSEPESDV
jgi:hypothetical protein